MTNDKTVTMSRELAERLDSPHSFVRNAAREELRATLAKSDDADKVNNREMGLMQFVEKHAAPVVERQPVAYAMESMLKRIKAKKGATHAVYGLPEDGYDMPLYTSPPAPVAVVQQCRIGIYGKAYDAPGTVRAYTYDDQPDNEAASKLGKAALSAKPGGDSIDYGLSLLKALKDEGFGVFEIDKVKELNQ